MTKISFVITVFNKERYIGKVIDSLKKISDPYWKEFIFIDDGSTDESLNIIRKNSLELPNTVIISRENKGPSVSTNEGLFLARGNYIKFLDGDDIIDPKAVSNLLATMQKHEVKVAFGSVGKFDHERNISIPGKIQKKECLIDNPIKALLQPKIKSIRTIGSSASMVSKDIIDEIGGSDNEIFVQDFSLSLRCASRSNFAFCPDTVCYTPLEYDNNNLSKDKEFEAYNTIMALRNFLDFDPIIAKKYNKDIYRSVISSIWKKDRKNYSFVPTYISSKLFIKNMSVAELKNFIDQSIEKFFKF